MHNYTLDFPKDAPDAMHTTLADKTPATLQDWPQEIHQGDVLVIINSLHRSEDVTWVVRKVVHIVWPESNGHRHEIVLKLGRIKSPLHS